MFVQPEFHPNGLALTNQRVTTANSTAVAISTVACNLYSINITNGHTAVVYVKFYDIAAASVLPASDVPQLTMAVQAASTTTLRGFDLPEYFATALSVRAVTNAGDTGTTAPGTLPIIEVKTCKFKTGN